MKGIAYYLYNLVLALWTGGIFIFTFLITPAVFRHFNRDMAGQIVGVLFPFYFPYNLLLSVLTLLLCRIFATPLDNILKRLSLLIIISAIIVNLFVNFKLHPDIRNLKAEIKSFEVIDRDSDLLRRFKRLHAVSATLNLILLLEGSVLLLISSRLKPPQ